MKPTLVKDRTHCPKGHDLRLHGYYFGTNQRCRACNRRRVRDEPPLAQEGQYGAILFPDSPFPSARDEIAKGASTGTNVNDPGQLLPWVENVPVHSKTEC
jgi:hypothetical protein